MPFTGQYTYTPLQTYINQQAGNDWSAKYGVPMQTNRPSALINQDVIGPGEIKNPYYGLDSAGIANSYTGGQDPTAWFNDYIKKTYNGAPEGMPTLENGQVKQNLYKDPGDAEGLGVMALAGGGLFGMAGAAGALSSAGGSFTGADAPWGVNAATGAGGNVADGTDWLTQYLSDAGGGVDTGLRDLSQLGSPTNMQDYITNLDKTPQGKAYLDNLIGGSTDAAGGGSFLSKLFSNPSAALSALGAGSANSGNLASVLGKLGAAGLGALASTKQSSALTDLANKYSEYGAPSRARYEASMQPGFDPTTIPGYSGALDTASKGLLARLSATGGNPYGNPAGLVQANKDLVSGTALPAINEYQRLNLSSGGLGNLNAAVPALQQGAIGQNANVYNALGYGLNTATQPTQLSTADLIKALGLGGLT